MMIHNLQRDCSPRLCFFDKNTVITTQDNRFLSFFFLFQIIVASCFNVLLIKCYTYQKMCKRNVKNLISNSVILKIQKKR